MQFKLSSFKTYTTCNDYDNISNLKMPLIYTVKISHNFSDISIFTLTQFSAITV